VTMKTIQI